MACIASFCNSFSRIIHRAYLFRKLLLRCLSSQSGAPSRDSLVSHLGGYLRYGYTSANFSSENGEYIPHVNRCKVMISAFNLTNTSFVHRYIDWEVCSIVPDPVDLTSQMKLSTVFYPFLSSNKIHHTQYLWNPQWFRTHFYFFLFYLLRITSYK